MANGKTIKRCPCRSCDKKDKTGKGGCGGYGCMIFKTWFRETWRTFQLHYLGYIPKPKPVEETEETAADGEIEKEGEKE